MELLPVKYERHIFVCINERENEDCCAKKDSIEILQALRDHINKNGLVGKYNVTKTKCLGHCKDGPTIAVYPEGKIFTHVSLEDIDKIIALFLNDTF